MQNNFKLSLVNTNSIKKVMKRVIFYKVNFTEHLNESMSEQFSKSLKNLISQYSPFIKTSEFWYENDFL